MQDVSPSSQTFSLSVMQRVPPSGQSCGEQLMVSQGSPMLQRLVFSHGFPTGGTPMPQGLAGAAVPVSRSPSATMPTWMPQGAVPVVEAAVAEAPSRPQRSRAACPAKAKEAHGSAARGSMGSPSRPQGAPNHSLAPPFTHRSSVQTEDGVAPRSQVALVASPLDASTHPSGWQDPLPRRMSWPTATTTQRSVHKGKGRTPLSGTPSNGWAGVSGAASRPISSRTNAVRVVMGHHVVGGLDSGCAIRFHPTRTGLRAPGGHEPPVEDKGAGAKAGQWAAAPLTRGVK